MRREQPGALLARRTRTIRMCSFDARSKGQPRPLPLREAWEAGTSCWTRAVESIPAAPANGPLAPLEHPYGGTLIQSGKAGRAINPALLEAFLSSLKLIPLFVAEREQPRLWISSTSGTSNYKILLTQVARVARKKLLDEFHEAEHSP
jgi:hypothetical protein